MAAKFDPYAAAIPGIATLAPYNPGMPMEELNRRYGITDSIKLASNENPLGPSPCALDAIRERAHEIAFYPDGNGWRLKQALAETHGVSTEQITLGNGSNEVLELASRAFVRPDDAGIISRHAFIVYYLALVCAQARICVADAVDYGHDLDAMADLVDERTRIIFVANPNNPTGTWSKADALSEFLDRVPEHVIVVIDEAYAEYVEEPDYPNCIQWLKRHSNLIVTRTFSKIYALAGLRVGYAVSSPAIADLLNRVRAPFNVNSLGLVAATASLSDDGHVRRSRQLNSEQLRRLKGEFAAMGYDSIESVGNFLTVDMAAEASDAYEALLHRGVIVRPLAGYQLPNHLRVTVGTAEQNGRMLEEFRALAA